MPAVARMGDPCAGHGCFPPRPGVASTGKKVLTNGIETHKQGDPWNAHCCGIPCHGAELVAGSGTVFVNGKPINRIGDPVVNPGLCSTSIAAGSGNVFAGG